MVASHQTVLYDIHDAKVYALLTDGTGASPTYGAAVDVPGMAQVGLDPNLVTAELKGDARVMAKKGRTDRFNFQATYGKLDLDVLKVILGFTVEDNPQAESGSAERVRARLASPAPLPYFMLKFKIDDLDTGLGSVVGTLYKCQLTGGTLIGSQTDQFGQPTMQLEAINPDHQATPMIDVDFYETVQTLS